MYFVNFMHKYALDEGETNAIFKTKICLIQFLTIVQDTQ